MMLNKYRAYTDSNKHVVYVGLTRAKNELYICYNTDDLDKYKGGNAKFMYDSSKYDEANEAAIQLSHKGVNLGYFKYVGKNVRQLCSGDDLYMKNDELFMDKEMNKRVVKLSRSQVEQINSMRKRGFEAYRAEVRNLVYWQGKEEKEESLIVLPNIYLRRNF